MADRKRILIKVEVDSKSQFTVIRTYPKFNTTITVENNTGSYPEPMPQRGDVVELEVMFTATSFEIYVNSHFLVAETEMHSPNGSYQPEVERIDVRANNFIQVLTTFLNVSKYIFSINQKSKQITMA